MRTNISLVTIYVTDQDEAKAFYVNDVRLGEGFRWVTVGHPAQAELEITLMVPGPPLDEDMAGAVRRAPAKGSMGGFGIRTDDCHKTYQELRAKGVDFVQPPSDRPYGIDTVMRDNSGNWLVLVENRNTCRRTSSSRSQGPDS